MPSVDGKFQTIFQCEENIEFDKKISQFKGAERPLYIKMHRDSSTSFMQVWDA